MNNFVVLARYHYYDGAPLTTIISRTTMLVGADSSSGNPAGGEPRLHAAG